MIQPVPKSDTPTLPLLNYRAHSSGDLAVAVRKDLVYGRGAIQWGRSAKDLRLDAFLPADHEGRSLAALLLFHGGGFVGGDKADLHEECHWFARRGFAAFIVQYRLMGDFPPVAPAPGGNPSLADFARAAVVDAKTALRWVHARAAEFGIHPGWIFLGGVSAGAITALAAGVTPREAFLTDLPGQPVPPMDSPGASMAVAGILSFCGALYGHVGAVNAASPPLFIHHGTEDRTVPFELALALRDRCRAVGLDHEFHAIAGAGHCPGQADAEGRGPRELAHAFLLRRLDPAPGS